MWNQKDLLIFLAGAEAFHTLSHIIFSVSGNLPLTFFSITLTPQLNRIAILANALITIGLLWWASRLT